MGAEADTGIEATAGLMEGGSMRVLVVDDEAEVRQVVRRSLERAGFDVVEAGDAEAALHVIQHEAADVAVLDLHLPGMSGLELMVALRVDDPDLPVIMLSGSGGEADRVRGLVSGADDYVTKPFSAAELAARVTAAGRRRSLGGASGRGGTVLELASDLESLTGTSPTPASQARPALAADLTSDATVVIAGDQVVHANHAVLELVGADTPSQVVGRSFFDFIAPQSLGAAIARRREAVEGRWPRPEVITVRRLDGEELTVEAAAMPVLWDGNAASQVTLWDLTGHTSRLRELATGIRSEVADAVMITDVNLRIQSFNPAAEVLYGWREEEVVGRSAIDVLPWVREDSTYEEVREAFDRDGRWHGEIVQRRRDGSLITVRSSTTLLRDRHGQPVGIITVNRPAHGTPTAGDPTTLAEDEAIDGIRHGIDHGEFLLHYQPIVRLDDGAWVGVEGLVRWEHPRRGLLPPAAFIDVAERSGLIIDLGQQVLAEATQQWRRWADAGMQLDMAVNLSGRQLMDPNLTARVADAMGAVSMPPGAIQLEVTETSLVEDLADATEVLTHLVDLGAEIAIDDFGTGWASLTYLREFPIQALKIDRVFVDGLGTNVSDTAIVSSIISLGSELGLSVIAEGIETADQLDRLRRLGCRRGQGYHFARPMPADELTERMR